MFGPVKVVLLAVLFTCSRPAWAKLSLLSLSAESEHSSSHGQSVSMEEALDQLETNSMFQRRDRVRRAAMASTSTTSSNPIIHGNHSFPDNNTRAIIRYIGVDVILVLTYSWNSQRQSMSSQLYRSNDYGQSFVNILDQVDTTNTPALWYNFFITSFNKVVFNHASAPILYLSADEGLTWTKTTVSPPTLDLRTLQWNSENAALAHDPTTDMLYVSRDLGKTWKQIAKYVDDGSGFQWSDPDYDEDHSLVYFNAYNPTDHKSGSNVTVSLFTQHFPYTDATQQEFDPSLGRHDDFLLLGPYIYAQKTDPQGVISLYTSYNRGSFMQTKIPSSEPHMNYLVSHIDALQALVVIQHASGQFNLYLSDVTAVYFSLSLQGITHRRGVIDLDIVDGVNGTLMANQYINGGSSGPSRSLISLDNGANWELVRPPTTGDCSPPQCSLHLHMRTTSYGRTAIYSQDSAPGLIMAHGNTGQTLSTNPDLYVSRDGGVSWSLTLQGSWGVTVVDHGGLLVAAKDYHQVPSTQLQYSCDEGLHWTPFTYTDIPLTVFGVITEPGEHTTIVSLYGTARQDHVWDVISIEFSPIFPRNCSSSDFYLWHPWDDRSAQSCLLGNTVTIERRNASVCCLIGQDYSRPSQFSRCSCTEQDFECAYGYEHSDAFTGYCVKDSSVTLDPTCTDPSAISYMKSQGYQKIAGDVCVGGAQNEYLPIETACPVTCSSPVALIIVSVLLAVFILTTVILSVATSYFYCRWSSVFRVERVRQRAPRVQFRSTDSQSSTNRSSTVAQEPLLHPAATGGDDDDDDPLAL